MPRHTLRYVAYILLGIASIVRGFAISDTHSRTWSFLYALAGTVLVMAASRKLYQESHALKSNDGVHHS